MFDVFSTKSALFFFFANDSWEADLANNLVDAIITS